MASVREAANSNLPPLRPILCETCGGAARLTLAEISGDGGRVRENLTYTCDACGAEMTRVVKSW